MENLSDEYELSNYKDFGPLDGKEKIRLVRNELDNDICVKKILQPESERIYLFLKEHPSPCFPKIRVCVRQEDQLIVIEEYIRGKSIAQLVSEKCFEDDKTARIALKITEALGILHHASPPIIDRDIKAENIMITEDDEVKLVDFDIAREYEEDEPHDTQALGTRPYAAPEQFGFSQSDERTDIYAVGVLINYMVTGKFPEQELLGGRLKEIAVTCMNLDPGKRYQSVEDLRQALLTAFPQEEAKAKTGKAEPNASALSGGYSEQEVDDVSDSFLPPGFRHHRPLRMIVAILVYVLGTCFCFTLEFTDAAGVPEPMVIQMCSRILIWLAMMGSIFFIWDYRGIRKKIRFLNSESQFLRILADIVVILILLSAAILISAILLMVLD